MIEQLETQIKVVAKARQEAEEADHALRSARAIWEVANHLLLGSAKEAAQLKENEEILLRGLTLQAYAEDPTNKAPAPGVSIRVVTKLDYDIAKAMEWAMEHRIALQLNKPAFDKLVKTAPETRPAFVMVTTEPQATIATKLEVE